MLLLYPLHTLAAFLIFYTRKHLKEEGKYRNISQIVICLKIKHAKNVFVFPEKRAEQSASH
jgi:hypothetical protein